MEQAIHECSILKTLFVKLYFYSVHKTLYVYSSIITALDFGNESECGKNVCRESFQRNGVSG